MKSNIQWRSSVSRVLVALAFTAGVLACSAAWAVPIHPNDQGKIQYPNPLPNPLLNHSHVGGIGVKEVNPSAAGAPGPHMVDSAATETWRTYSAWDNRTYRNGDAAGQPYGHGYIEPTDATRPRYLFGAAVPGTPGATGVAADLTNIKNDIQSIWQSWQAAAKGQGEALRTTPDGTPLSTGLSFRESVAADAGAKEIDINFVAGGQFGVWSPGAQTLRFNLTPQTNVFVSTAAGALNPDWQVTSDGLALNAGGKAWAASAAITLPWNFTNAAPTTAGVPNAGDLDYKCVNVAGCGAAAFNQTYEGNEAAFLALGLKVADTAGGAVINASDSPIVQADFISVALHEWGHIVGLDHVTPAAATMNAASPFTLGVLTRTIDVGSAKGAAVLYSIPVPEPATLLTVLMAATCVGGCRRRWN